jgi:hypothetical protein
MSLNFDQAISVGRPSDLVERTRREDEKAPRIPKSGVQRGLTIKSLRITSRWDSLWSFLGRRQQIYFLTVAFDLSGDEPVILPPSTVSADAVYRVTPGDTIAFTLGDGAPLFPLREIHGGLVVYISVIEADKGVRHVGEVMTKVHEDLKKDGSLVDILQELIKNPTATIADEVLSAATAALQPIATILQNNGDDYIALFNGIYPAKGPWAGKLEQTQNGATIVLGELRSA